LKVDTWQPVPRSAFETFRIAVFGSPVRSRSTCPTFLVDVASALSETTIQRSLKEGYSSITQTMDTYSHLMEGMGGDAVVELDEAFKYSYSQNSSSFVVDRPGGSDFRH